MELSPIQLTISQFTINNYAYSPPTGRVSASPFQRLRNRFANFDNCLALYFPNVRGPRPVAVPAQSGHLPRSVNSNDSGLNREYSAARFTSSRGSSISISTSAPQSVHNA